MGEQSIMKTPKTPTIHAYHAGAVLCKISTRFGISREVFIHRTKKAWKKYKQKPCQNCAKAIASKLKKEINAHLDRLGL